MALRFGNVTQIDPDKGLAKVEFAEDGIESAWLSPVVSKTKDDKYYHMFDIGEHVACLMDDNAEEGVILGAAYSSKNTPGPKGKDVWGVQFSDGSTVTFDRSTGRLVVNTKGEITVETAKSVLLKAPSGLTIEADTTIKGELNVIGKMTGNGDMSIQGNVEVGGNFEAQGLVKGGGITLNTHTHNDLTSGGVTSPPNP